MKGSTRNIYIKYCNRTKLWRVLVVAEAKLLDLFSEDEHDQVMNIIGPNEESEYVTQDSTNAELLSDEENTYFDCKQCLARFDMEKHFVLLSCIWATVFWPQSYAAIIMTS